MVRERLLRPNVTSVANGLKLTVTTIALQWRRCSMTVTAEPVVDGFIVEGLTVFPKDVELLDDAGRSYKVGKAAHRVPWAGNKAWFSWAIPCPDPQAKYLKLVIHSLKRVLRDEGRPRIETIAGPWEFEVSLG
jgi:hypothetical protein